MSNSLTVSVSGVSKVLGNQDNLRAENYLLNKDEILVSDNQVEPLMDLKINQGHLLKFKMVVIIVTT